MESQSPPKSEFLCSKCDKKYASQSSLCNHNKKFHPKPQNIRICKEKIRETSVKNPEQQPQNEQKEKTYDCRYCDKIYNHKQNRWAHEKICEAKVEHQKQQEIEKQQDVLQNEIKILKKENEIIQLRKKIHAANLFIYEYNPSMKYSMRFQNPN